MKKSKFTEKRIAFTLRQAERGTPVTEVCRKMGIAEATHFRWRQRYGGFGPSERREIVRWIQDRYRVSERRSCAALRFDRSSHRDKTIRDDQAALRQRIKDIAAVRVRYGDQRIHILLRREGWVINHKRVLRLYREEGLNLRAMRPRRHVGDARRLERTLAQRANEVWAMDVVSDALFNGKRFRALTVVDAYTRECLAIRVDQNLRGDDVVAVPEQQLFLRGTAPGRVRVDNGPEFVSRVLDHWAYRHGVTLDFSRPGKPTDNTYIESFSG